MVARQGNNVKRKNGNKAGNFRKNFKQGHQQQQHQQLSGIFKQQVQRNGRLANMGAMFNQNQMLDNPGYMDFNEPTVRLSYPQKNLNNKNIHQNGNGVNNGQTSNKGNKNHGRAAHNNFNNQFLNNNNQRNNKRNANGNIGGGGGGVNNMNFNSRFGGQLRNNPQNCNFGMNSGGINSPFCNNLPPMPSPMGPMRPGNFDGYGQQFFPQRFGPMMPPQMGMMRPPIMPRRPLPNNQMLPTFRGNNSSSRGQELRRKFTSANNTPINKRRPNQKVLKGRKKADRKTGKKLNPSGDKYPLNKPWVNDEIKAAHDKKVALSNQLKGKKDDQLFAEFKEQRDIFVKLYEAARLLHTGKSDKQVNFIATKINFNY